LFSRFTRVFAHAATERKGGAAGRDLMHTTERRLCPTDPHYCALVEIFEFTKESEE
jgi:hypothetical protein